jgi:cytochrome b pre-mRNA-processing protein 3
MRDLIKECSRPGEYKIPQALVKNGEIPVDENGVHLGEGDGWWYEGMHCHTHNETWTWADPMQRLA